MRKKRLLEKLFFKKIINWLINEKSKNYTGVD